VPGAGGLGSGLCGGGSGFGGGVTGVGVGLWLTLAVVQMAHRCRRCWRTLLGHVVVNKVKLGFIGAAAVAGLLQDLVVDVGV
jgi:hypothetical protein